MVGIADERVLWVDDDADLLVIVQRVLRGVVSLDACGGGDEALKRLGQGEEYAVIVSDMQMPGMDGIALLNRVKERWPETVRMMFTGLDDQATAVQALNDGRVFRFLNKAAGADEITTSIQAALAEHASRRAERAVLESTLVGAVRALIDVLAITQPSAFGRGARIRALTRDVCRVMGVRAWEVEIAATVSQLGCVTLPQVTMQRIVEGRTVSPEEQALFDSHPQVGSELLGKIPRLEGVASIVRYQHKRFDGTGTPIDVVAGEAIPFGARVLKAVLDFDRLGTAGSTPGGALVRMRSREGWYDPSLLVALETVANRTARDEVRLVEPHELAPGMVLAGDLLGRDGSLIATCGQEVTTALVRKLRNDAQPVEPIDRIRVFAA